MTLPNESNSGWLERLLRRRHERTPAVLLDKFACRVIPKLRSVDPGVLATIVDCSAGGVGLLLPASIVEAPKIDGQLFLRFVRKHDGERVELVGRLHRVEKRESGWSIGLGYVDFERVESDVRGSWWRLFNRRRLYRAAFVGKERPRVRVLGGGLSLDAKVDDIGLLGIGVDFDPELAPAVAKLGSAWLHVAAAPGFEALSAAMGELRHATRLGSLWRAGFAWLPEKSREWNVSQEALLRFINARQLRERGGS